MALDPAEFVPLAAGTESVQRLTLGLGPLGNLYKVVTDSDAHAVLGTWWNAGLRTFDVAPLYGYGIAEERLGRFLTERGETRFVVSTKVGRPLRVSTRVDSSTNKDSLYSATPPGVSAVFDFSARAVRHSLESSLKRLNLERVNIAYVHDPQEHMRQALGEAAPELAALRDEGLVGAIGVGTASLSAAVRFVREGSIDCLMLAGRYTLLQHDALDELLPLCQARGISVVNASVLNSGFLADPRIGARYEYAPTSNTDLVDRALRIRAVCEIHRVPLLAAAIQFSAAHPAVVSVAVGVGSVAHAVEADAMYRLPIPRSLWDDLRGEGLIRPEAPVGLT